MRTSPPAASSERAHGPHDAPHSPEGKPRGAAQDLPSRVVILAATLDDASDIGRIISHVAEPGDSGLVQFDMTPSIASIRLEVPGFEELVEQVGDAAEEYPGERLLVLGRPPGGR